jgi:hypothetical protein
VGEELLFDIKQIFATREAAKLESDRISSSDLCATLGEIALRPWAEWGRRRKPISQNQIAHLLKPFGITPATIRLQDNSTAKGYYLKDFIEAFSSYVPVPPDPDRHNVTTTGGVGENGDFRSVTEPPCDVSENGTSPYGEKECDGVTDQNHGSVVRTQE